MFPGIELGGYPWRKEGRRKRGEDAERRKSRGLQLGAEGQESTKTQDNKELLFGQTPVILP